MSNSRRVKKASFADTDVDIDSKRGSVSEKRKSKLSLAQRTARKLNEYLKRSESGIKGGNEGQDFKKEVLGAMVVAESGQMIGSRRDKIQLFEDDQFDAEAFSTAAMANLTEKALDTLRGDLTALQEHCEEEVHRVVHTNYPAFIQACEGAADLEAQFQQVRSQLTQLSAIISDLKQAVQPAPAKFGPALSSSISEASIGVGGPTKVQLDSLSKEVPLLAGLLDGLDIAIAERDFVAAAKALDQADSAISGEVDTGNVPSTLRSVLEERRQQMVHLMELQMQDPTLGASGKQGVLRVLSGVAGNVHTVRMMLSGHSKLLRQQQQQLLKPHRTGGRELDSTEYACGLSQCVFVAIKRAADDVRSVFGHSAAALSGLLVVWVRQEVRVCAQLWRQHAFSGLAGPTGLGSTLRCFSVVLVYAMALEDVHQLSVVEMVREEFWPEVDGVLQRHIQTIADQVCHCVAEDMDAMLGGIFNWTEMRRPTAGPPALLPSGRFLLQQVEFLAGLLRPVAFSAMHGRLRSGCARLFQSFTASWGDSLAKHLGEGGALPDALEGALELVMDSAALLAEDGLPAGLAGLEEGAGFVCDRERMVECVDELATVLGMKEVQA